MSRVLRELGGADGPFIFADTYVLRGLVMAMSEESAQVRRIGWLTRRTVEDKCKANWNQESPREDEQI